MNIKQSIPASKRNKLEKGENIIVQSSLLFSSILELNGLKALLLNTKYQDLKELSTTNPSIKMILNNKLGAKHANGLEVTKHAEITSRLENFKSDYNDIVISASTVGFLGLKIEKNLFNSSLDEEGEVVKKQGYLITLVKFESDGSIKVTNVTELVEKVTTEIISEKIIQVLTNIENISVTVSQ